ncbi:hypothetical protein SESBI_20957 [Sesbania bispinosa]|nr:hypothetical protein SESBI_20957 [Sesbania bispinosa]
MAPLSPTFEIGSNVPENSKSIFALNTQNSIKLIDTNYPTWRVQLNALFIGYDLIGFVDSTHTCPSPTHRD